MAPLQEASAAVREQRLQDGCCPNCGTRLYKVASSSHSVMPKFPFRKKSSGSGRGKGGGGEHASPAASKMTPLTIPGVVDRGQCVRCADGKRAALEADDGGGALATADAVLVPSVKAVPVAVKPAESATPATYAALPPDSPPGAKKPPPQSKSEARGGDDNAGNLKRPPEDLLLPSDPEKVQASVSVDESASEDESSSGSDDDSSEYETDSEYDDNASLEERDLKLCRLESDHASSSLVNSLRHGHPSSGALEALGDDDRKPPAGPPAAAFPSFPTKRAEASDVDMAFLESSASAQPRTPEPGKKLECPSGMSPEVFDELPPDMQREILEQQGRRTESSGGGTIVDNSGGAASTPDIDPETLASLPDHIRKEVLEQARSQQQGQQQQQTCQEEQESNKKERLDVSGKKLERMDNGLTTSTTAFLQKCNIDEDDFVNFPEEVKNDIMREHRRSSGSGDVDIEPQSSPRRGGADRIRDLDRSEYDPDTLASLPEDVRKEVLADERRTREAAIRRREAEEGSRRARIHGVGAHSVHTPAGYDPETFEALPLDVQRELMDDAARRRGSRRYSAEGYDRDEVEGARVVRAQSVSPCTYTGEYNVMGKRHGDGELKWENGDVYRGKFKDGFIEGRGTICFHDGTEYAGQWKRNRFHGEGTRRFNNGNVYSGNYDSGKRQGQGKCYFANGDTYVGDWKDDTINGFGRYYYNNGHRQVVETT
ncbi:hypothetical protein ACHAWF_005158 [Thalassiosira exigua]